MCRALWRQLPGLAGASSPVAAAGSICWEAIHCRNGIFIIEFPTADAARRWYQSDDYQAALRSGFVVRSSAGPAGAGPSEFASAIKPRGCFATPSYLRLWLAGGIGNAMRWLELLAAGIFTYEVTQSTVMVALVTVTRSLPMLFIGTIAGVVGEALNRKRLLVTQLFVMAVNSATLCALAFSAQIQVW